MTYLPAANSIYGQVTIGPINLNIIPEPRPDLKPAELDFTDVPVGTSSTQEVTLDNAGTGLLMVHTTSSHVLSGPRSAMFWIPGALLAVLLSFTRKRVSVKMARVISLFALAAVALGATACSNAPFSTQLGTDNTAVIVNATATIGTGSTNIQQSLGIAATVR